jgi:Rrf2 family protein
MQLTRAADYAVRVVTHLASQPAGTVVPKSVLAKASDAPESFLAKILQALTRAGLIEARRGVDGGFFLLERGAQASLLDVIESIDGPISLNVCLNAEASCARASGCSAHQVWRQAQEAMLTVLREAKIAQMVAPQGCGACADPSQCFVPSKPTEGSPGAPSPAGSLPAKEDRIALPPRTSLGALRGETR